MAFLHPCFLVLIVFNSFILHGNGGWGRYHCVDCNCMLHGIGMQKRDEEQSRMRERACDMDILEGGAVVVLERGGKICMNNKWE